MRIVRGCSNKHAQFSKVGWTLISVGGHEEASEHGQASQRPSNRHADWTAFRPDATKMAGNPGTLPWQPTNPPSSHSSARPTARVHALAVHQCTGTGAVSERRGPQRWGFFPIFVQYMGTRMTAGSGCLATVHRATGPCHRSRRSQLYSCGRSPYSQAVRQSS